MRALAIFLLVLLLAATLGATAAVDAQESAHTPIAGADLIAREAELLYLLNVERNLVGVPPLRWNRELSEAGRWFAEDSVEDETPNCDHVDSQGEGLGMRMRRFGYNTPVAFGELLVCGFVEPTAALFGWKNSPDGEYTQKGLVLDARFREAGAAYYLNGDGSRGMVAVNLAGDLGYAPVVINLEAVTTRDPLVSLYIYPTQKPPVEMKISNHQTFAGAEWQPYRSEVDWTLTSGKGWRTVYVLTRDADGATSLASDSIWLGDGFVKDELSLNQASTIGVGFALDAFSTGSAEKVRLSLGWEYDDDVFTVYRGASDTVNDATAVGHTALRLRADGRESLVQARIDALPANRILTLYLRAKTDAVGGDTLLAEVALVAGERTFGPLRLRPATFAAPNQWQEFAIDFVVPAESDVSSVELALVHSGTQALWLDTLRVYGQPASTDKPVIWPVEENHARGQAMQARVDGAGGLGEPFDIAYTELDTIDGSGTALPALGASPGTVVFESRENVVAGQGQVVLVCERWCTGVRWKAASVAPWLEMVQAQEGMMIYVNPAGLAKGAYQSLITLAPVTARTEMATADAESEATVLRAWVDVRLYVDGAQPIPPFEVNATAWLPVVSSQ